MSKMKILRSGDMEPTCPSCGNDNVLLIDKTSQAINSFETGLKCKDCGYSVPVGTYFVSELVNKCSFKVSKKDIELIELDKDMLFYEVHIKTDKPQEPSYTIPATKNIIFLKNFIEFC